MIYPLQHYQSKLGVYETQLAIKHLKDTFEARLAKALNLTRVSAPLFLKKSSGLNDDLNGVERKVHFTSKCIGKEEIQVVQSLAKWKRFALGKYAFEEGQGLYADMNAIRRDETLDNLHSLYVDQWDWEKVIDKSKRNKETLREVVRTIYQALKEEEQDINSLYPSLSKKLPEEITFITSKELEAKYPGLNRKEREKAFAKEVKAYFLEEIGWPLEDEKPHDGRAPDYDDWHLNGDIILYHEVLDCAFEISSMGIRVDEESLLKQVEYQNKLDMLVTPYCQAIIKKKLPYTIGGGIGQSRLCMFFLEKAHIGEIQASLWEDSEIDVLKEMGINLL